MYDNPRRQTIDADLRVVDVPRRLPPRREGPRLLLFALVPLAFACGLLLRDVIEKERPVTSLNPHDHPSQVYVVDEATWMTEAELHERAGHTG